MSAQLKPPTFARYERVRSFVEREPYFQERLKGKPVTLVKPDGNKVTVAAEIVGITNYLHAHAPKDVMLLGKRVIVDTASALISNGSWEAHMPQDGRVIPVAVGKASVDAGNGPAPEKRSRRAPRKEAPEKTAPAANGEASPKAAAPRTSRKAAQKKSDAPIASPQATEPKVGCGSPDNGAPEKADSSRSEDQTPIPSESPARGQPEPAPIPEAPRNRVSRRPVPPQYQWAIPVISLLVGVEQIVEAFDQHTGADGRIARLRSLTEDFQRILENKSRAEATPR